MCLCVSVIKESSCIFLSIHETHSFKKIHLLDLCSINRREDVFRYRLMKLNSTLLFHTFVPQVAIGRNLIGFQYKCCSRKLVITGFQSLVVGLAGHSLLQLDQIVT